MKTPKKDSQTMTVSLDPDPKGEFKILGGSRSDDWNLRLSNLVVGALPIQQSNSEAVIFASRVRLPGNDGYSASGPHRRNTHRAIDGGQRSCARALPKGLAERECARVFRGWNEISAHEAPRCRAKSKRTGKPCRAPAVRGSRVCRMHGAGGGAPTGKRMGIIGTVRAQRRRSTP
jgi:hypothetical protein